MLLYSTLKPCVCGCRVVGQQKRKLTLEQGDIVVEIWMKCIRCNKRTLVQKTRTYAIVEGLKRVELSPKELEMERTASGDWIHDPHRN